MSTKPADTTSRSFNPASVAGIPSTARDAVNDAFDAMRTWRTEMGENNEKNLKRVIDKMAAAGAALGWPEQITEAARFHLQSMTEMQSQTIDHLISAWEEQLKSPNPMNASPEMFSKLQLLPGSSATAANPLEFWTQVAQQWQKSWSEAMAFWARAGKPH